MMAMLEKLEVGQTAEVSENGHEFRVTATHLVGWNTGRRRYRVECVTCGIEVHEATTGPESLVNSHLRNVASELR